MDSFVILLLIITIIVSIRLYYTTKACQTAEDECRHFKHKADSLSAHINELRLLLVEKDNEQPLNQTSYSPFPTEKPLSLNERSTYLNLQTTVKNLLSERDLLSAKCSLLEQKASTQKEDLTKILSSNLSSIPWLSGMMADFLTYELEVEAKKLEWGHNVQRAKKVASIRQLRAEANAAIEKAKADSYQLEYLKKLFPAIDEIIETEYSDLHISTISPNEDSTRKYLSAEEWNVLSETQRNQLALDRYISSHRKTKWQIGRDYENAVAYEYRKKGYSVDNFGSYMGLSDMGRDIIAIKGDNTIIIQCKYWSKEKTIHEKHIYQLYGTLVSYSIEHNISLQNVHGVFVTNITLSEVAKQAAKLLSIRVAENHPMTEYPRIKCNIGRDELGFATKIYHLPMDDQYDTTKIDSKGEFYAFTVAEAENKGFRRAYKWHGTNT